MRYRSGARAELIFQSEFVRLGYDVFANVCPAGPVDLVVHNQENNTFIPCDVKSKETYVYNKDGTKGAVLGGKLGFHNGVWVIGYIHEGNEFIYPEGFWEAVNKDCDLE